MIAYLKGSLFEKKANEAVIDVQGVGYRVGISAFTFGELPAPGQPVTLRIYHHFSDSDQRLFGFITTEEKELFELLITVKNIGPRLALNILSGIDAPQMIGIIASQDVRRLSQIPGIGKKTAERLLLELRDKIEAVAAPAGGPGSGAAMPDPAAEAVRALQSLGYKKPLADETVRKIVRQSEPPIDTPALIREALKMLNK